MTDAHNSLRRAASVIVGLVFFASGMLKLMDPVGAGLVVTEYMKFFGTMFLDFLSGPAAVALALLETITGVALVTGVFRKVFAYVCSALLAFFTVITVILLIANPEMDCGCFGEAIHLSHLQTFLKNVVLMALAAFAFIPFREYGVPSRRKYWSAGLLSLISLCVLAYSSINLPLTDYTTFRISTVLAASESSDSGMEEEVQMSFVYEKDGREEAFDLENLPDSTWTFVRSEMVSQTGDDVKSQAALSIYNTSGQYFDYLASGGPVMIVSAYDPLKLKENRWAEVADFVQRAQMLGYGVLVLLGPVASSETFALPSSLDPENRIALEGVTFHSDYKTLISLNRSNAGVSFFMDGQLIQRWPAHAIPDDSLLETAIGQDFIDRMISVGSRSHLSMQAVFLVCFALML